MWFPILAGIISTLYVSNGDNVSNGTKIADVIDNSTMLLKLPFNSSDADRLHVGQSAAVTLDGSFEKLSGTVSSISSVENVLDGNMLVRDITIKVKNPGALTSSTFASATIGSVACNSGANFAPNEEKTITAKAAGEVGEIYYQEGARIKSGATILHIDSTSIDTDINTSALSLKDAQLSLQNTIDQMDNYNITSPIAGTVIEKDYKVGDTIDSTSNSTIMAIIYDMSSLVFEMPIDELDVGNVKVGQEVKITADALEGKEFTGTVDKVNIKGTTTNGVTTYPVTVVIKDANGLLPGMNVNASIVVQSSKDVLAIPVNAVSRGNIVLAKGNDIKTSGQNSAAPAANNSQASGGTSSGNASGGKQSGGNASGNGVAGNNASGNSASKVKLPRRL